MCYVYTFALPGDYPLDLKPTPTGLKLYVRRPGLMPNSCEVKELNGSDSVIADADDKDSFVYRCGFYDGAVEGAQWRECCSAARRCCEVMVQGGKEGEGSCPATWDG